jgi:mono/diheme cytochrome c family protein
MQRSMLRELLTIFSIITLLVIIIFKMDDGCNFKLSNDKPDNTKDTTTTKTAITDSYSRGRELFKSNCAACHNPLVQNTGPALKGVTARWEAAGTFKNQTGKQWLYAWIKNYNETVAQGYPYAIAMANSSGNVMNAFPQLTDADIDNILVYVEQYKK